MATNREIHAACSHTVAQELTAISRFRNSTQRRYVENRTLGMTFFSKIGYFWLFFLLFAFSSSFFAVLYITFWRFIVPLLLNLLFSRSPLGDTADIRTRQGSQMQQKRTFLHRFPRFGFSSPGRPFSTVLGFFLIFSTVRFFKFSTKNNSIILLLAPLLLVPSLQPVVCAPCLVVLAHVFLD